MFFLAIFLGGFFVWPNFARAAATDIIFTEIMYDPAGSDTDHEWVEIYNSGADPVTLVEGSGTDSWRFFDGSNHTLTFVQGSLTIAPGGVAILASDATTFLTDHPGFTGMVLDTVMSLNNTTDTLKLSADKGVSWFGELTYQNTQGGSSDGKSLEKIGLVWQSSNADGGTPGTITTTSAPAPAPETPASSTSSPPPTPATATPATETKNFDSTKIKISELLPNPNNNEDEFIEIWNSGPETASLDGWKLGDTKKIITLEKITLVPNEYQVFYGSKTKISLNNSNETITLFDQAGNMIDKISYATSFKGQSYSYDISQNKFDWSITPTPGSYSNIVKPNDPPQARISFNYNPAAPNEEIIISGGESTDPDDDKLQFTWSIGEKFQASGESFTFKFALLGTQLVSMIASDERHSVLATATIDILPSTEIIWLRSQQKNAPAIATTTTSAIKTKAAVKKPVEKTETPITTQVKTEALVADDGLVDVSLENIRDLELGTEVRVQGKVAVEPGVLAKSYFYITGSPGIQIYYSKSDWPKLTLGDNIGVIGVLAESGGETRLRLASKQDITIISKSDPPLPLAVETGSIDENVEGYLVKITGELAEKKGSSWLIDDGSGAAKITFQTSAKIKKPTVKVGEWLEIIGLVSETKTGYRILPRYQSDIRLLKPEEITDVKGEVLGETAMASSTKDVQRFKIPGNNEPQTILKYLLITAAALIILLVGLVIKMRVEIKKRREEIKK